MFKKYAIELSNQSQCKVPFLFPLSFFFIFCYPHTPSAKGASKKLRVQIPAFFFLFWQGKGGGGGGWNRGIKTETSSELACSPRGYSRFQITRFSIEGGTRRLIAAYFGIYSRLLCV